MKKLLTLLALGLYVVASPVAAQDAPVSTETIEVAEVVHDIFTISIPTGG